MCLNDDLKKLNMKKYIAILFIAFNYCSSVSDHERLYKSLIDFAYEMSDQYEAGLGIDDCQEQTVHWAMMYRYNGDEGLTDVVTETLLLLEHDLSSESIGAFYNYSQETNTYLETTTYCVIYSSFSDSCNMCNEPLRITIENTINELYILIGHFEANRWRYNINS